MTGVTSLGFAGTAEGCVMFSMSPGREERTAREIRWLVPRTTSRILSQGDHVARCASVSGLRDQVSP